MRYSFVKNICLPICVFALFLSVPSYGSDDVIGFDSEHWQLGPACRVEEHLGRKALTLTGLALLKDVVFENGIIEVDVASKEGTVFPTIIFHVQDESNYEEFYLRPHKSGQPDALQYTPVFNGLSGWQLYYGEGFTNAYPLALNAWTHIRMEIAGTQARVFIGQGENPALVINELKHGQIRGSLGLKVVGAPGLSYFSDFKFKADDSLKFDSPLKTSLPYGTMTEWELSQSYPMSFLDTKKYPPAEILSRSEWKNVVSEPTGLVNIARYARKGPVVPGVVLARTKIPARDERSMELQFGYSDIVSIFLNGRLLFNGYNLFQLRDPFFQGRVGLFDAVHLPLKKGDNELLLVLAESMGGWGFMCRAGDAVYLDANLTPCWELSHKLSYPETVLYDPAREVLYVSNTYSDGPQFLSKVKLNGDIENREWVQGLSQPTGMALFGNKLFVVERASVVEIDIPSGEIVKKHAVPSPGFLNDIALDEEGTIYISDSQKGQILKFSGGQFSTWKSGNELAQVNGLQYSKGRLIAGFSSDASLRSIDLRTGEVKTLAKLDPGAIVDGIEEDEKGNFLVSDFNGKIFLVSPEGQKTLLLDSTAPRGYCANFAWAGKKNLLVVPSLTDNRLIAFKWNPK